MKFIVNSTELMSHLQAISRVINSKNNLPILDNFLFNIKGNNTLSLSSNKRFNFNKKLIDLNLLSKLKNISLNELHISKYEKTNNSIYDRLILNIESFSTEIENDRIELSRSIDFKTFISGSVRQLIRRLALYTGQIQSALFRVLRNTHIHSLSIFFGLCCSRSGYIFEAITGTSSHPVSVNA